MNERESCLKDTVGMALHFLKLGLENAQINNHYFCRQSQRVEKV